METRAPFIVVGAFVLAAIAAVFGFVYWLHNSAGIGARSSYHLQFDGPVPGLLVGASVLFNGIRVALVGMGVAHRRQRGLFYGLVGIALVLFVVGAVLIFTQ